MLFRSAVMASSMPMRSLTIASTAAQIGISTLYFAASATTAGALSMPSAKYNVEMPICAAVDAIVNERIGIDEAITALLSRPFKAESA